MLLEKQKKKHRADYCSACQAGCHFKKSSCPACGVRETPTELSSVTEEQAALLEEQKQNVRGEWSSISEENTLAHEDQKKVYTGAMDMEEHLKAQYAALEAGQHAASDAQALILEQQGAPPATNRDACMRSTPQRMKTIRRPTKPPCRLWTRRSSSRLKLQSWIQCNTPHQTHKAPSWSSKRLTSETD